MEYRKASIHGIVTTSVVDPVQSWSALVHLAGSGYKKIGTKILIKKKTFLKYKVIFLSVPISSINGLKL